MPTGDGALDEADTRTGMASAQSDQHPDAEAAAAGSSAAGSGVSRSSITGDGAPAVDTADEPRHWLRKVILFLSGQTVSLFGSMLVSVRGVLVPHGDVPVRHRDDARGAVRVPPAGRRSRSSAACGPTGTTASCSSSARTARSRSTTLALAIIMMSGYDEVWLIFLDDGAALGRRGHPDARGLGAHPPDHADGPTSCA